MTGSSVLNSRYELFLANIVVEINRYRYFSLLKRDNNTANMDPINRVRSDHWEAIIWADLHFLFIRPLRCRDIYSGRCGHLLPTFDNCEKKA